jgi:hypothetical protein
MPFNSIVLPDDSTIRILRAEIEQAREEARRLRRVLAAAILSHPDRRLVVTRASISGVNGKFLYEIEDFVNDCWWYVLRDKKDPTTSGVKGV